MSGMMIRFEAMTDIGAIYEGYAHNSEEARQKVKDQLPEGTRFEVFFGSHAPQFLTFEQFQQCRDLRLPDSVILRFDQRLQQEFDRGDDAFDLETLKLALDIMIEYGVLRLAESNT